jgi:peroxiredoxin
MKTKGWIASFLTAVLVVVLLAGVVFAQAPALGPVTVGRPMPDFTLPTYQGGNVTLSTMKGKIVMIVFPRGLAGEGRWCHVCNYQHAELAEFDAKAQFRQKSNLEILFVFPYGKDQITEWLDKYPEQLADLEAWKNPVDPAKLDEKGRQRMTMARKEFPKAFRATKGQVLSPFPILLDPDRTVSKGLGLFATDWGGSKVDQNIPTIFVVDQNGILQFKYISQNTLDRPGLQHLVKFVDGLTKTK